MGRHKINWRLRHAELESAQALDSVHAQVDALVAAESNQGVEIIPVAALELDKADGHQPRPGIHQ